MVFQKEGVEEEEVENWELCVLRRGDPLLVRRTKRRKKNKKETERFEKGKK